MKLPDRWERMVNKEFGVVKHSDPIDAGVANGIYREAATKLLRQEHRWVRRMVQKVYNWQAEQLADNEDACYEILKQLNGRAK